MKRQSHPPIRWLNWGIVGWATAIAVAASAIGAVVILTATSTDSCTAHGGREVFQYFLPGVKGTLTPVYACQKP